MEIEQTEPGAASVDQTATATDKGAVPEFSWNEESIGALPEQYRPHVQGLLEKAQQYEGISKHLGDQKFDDVWNSYNEYQNYNKFAAENGIQPEQVTSFLDAMAAFKQDPKAGVESLYKMTADMAMRQGLMLRPDLEQEVKEGKLSPERARELHAMWVQTQDFDKYRKGLETRNQQALHQDRRKAFQEWGESSPLKSNEQALNLAGRMLEGFVAKNPNATRQEILSELKSIESQMTGLTGTPAQAAPPKTEQKPAGFDANEAFMRILNSR